MAYQTISSRSIVIPELGVTLHFHSIELPTVIKGAMELGSSEQVDGMLVQVCQEVFRLGPNEIISFSEWRRSSQQVLTALDSTGFDDRQASRSAQDGVAANVKMFGDPGRYLEGLLINGLVAPRQQRIVNPEIEWFTRISSSSKLAPDFFTSLAVGSVSELGFANWYGINQLLYAQEYPSALVARREVPGFEIPVAGSKPIKAITIENFQKFCYGAAAMVMGETALSTAGAIGHGQPPVVAAVLGGAAAALVFASVGSLSRYLEEYLKSK